MLFDTLWSLFDVSSVIAIASSIYFFAKKINSYFQELNNNVAFIGEDIKEIKLTMLNNDIKVMIKQDIGKEDVARAYDSYCKLGGNGFIKREVEDYLNV